VVGGAIAQGLAWQWIFWINLPIAVISMVTRRIDESFGPSTALDMQGLALVTGSALGLLWGLMRWNSAGWSSPEVLPTLGAGLLLAATFVAWELRARAPMVPMRFFQARAFAAGIGASFFFYASMYGVLFTAECARSRHLDVLKECQARSMQLLKENLSAAQREQYKRCNYFDVIGGATG